MATIKTLKTFTPKNHPTISVELSKLTNRKGENLYLVSFLDMMHNQEITLGRYRSITSANEGFDLHKKAAQWGELYA
tara:strand:- start:351 stop:581 length:231 start_codon:yes stop_codon:yes gene_type:complete